jgi:hypothetical protein
LFEGITGDRHPGSDRRASLIAGRLSAWLDRRDRHCLQASVHLGGFALELSSHAEQPARDFEIPAELRQPQTGCGLVTEVVCIWHMHVYRPVFFAP